MQRRTLQHVQPAEDEPLTGGVEVDPPGGGGERLDVPLVHRLRRAGPGAVPGLPLAHGGLGAQHLEPGQGAVDHDLLPCDLPLELRHRPAFLSSCPDRPHSLPCQGGGVGP